MKRKFADARGIKDILESEYSNYRIDDEEFHGYISILQINKVKQEWFVDAEERCILANNYIWIEMYPDNENYCITVMYNENKNIVEWYFDICKCNGIKDCVPYEDDLYLDVVIVPDGRVHILDEDELLEALNKNEITEKELNLAYSTKDFIIEKYSKDINKLTKVTNQYKEKLLGIHLNQKKEVK